MKAKTSLETEVHCRRSVSVCATISVPRALLLAIISITLWSSCSPARDYNLIIRNGMDYDGLGAPPSEAQYDIVIHGGLVYDGMGNPPVRADLGIVADRIVHIGKIPVLRASPSSNTNSTRRIDAAGKVVVPGFIDIHSHATSTSFEESGIVLRPGAENYIRQGVTTVMGGQDGSSPIDIGAFLMALDSIEIAINVGLFIGHGSIRARVIGETDRPPTADDITIMTAMVHRAMQEGAFGLSSGLEYTPAVYADNTEIIAIARPAAEAGGLYISHIRDEGAHLIESIEEVIEVAEKAGMAAQITHHKVIGKGRWGGSAQSLALIDRARGRGLDVSSDVYPYTASSTGLTILFPAWSKEGGTQALVERLTDSGQRDRIRTDVVRHINEERGGDPFTIIAARCPKFSVVDGLSLGEILQQRGLTVTVEGAADIAIELIQKGGCLGVFHSMSEEDVRAIMQHASTMISSDGGIPDPGVGVPHPRNYGAFARVLALYVRELKILSMEEAVFKMSGLPAQRLGLQDRGHLLVGSIADITLLDPETIEDHALFGDPHHYASGVSHVLVGGRIVLSDAQITEEKPGVALRRKRIDRR